MSAVARLTKAAVRYADPSFTSKLEETASTPEFSSALVEQLGSATVGALSSLIWRGVLTSPSCATRRPEASMGSILQVDGIDA